MIACLVWLFLSISASYYWLKTTPQSALFVTLAISVLFLFWGALAGHLVETSYLIFFLSLIAGSVAVFQLCKQRERLVALCPTLAFTLILTGIAFLLTRNLTLSHGDDYVYWGILGKYLFLFDHLPIVDNLILPKHLQYLPSMGILHYHFHQLFDQYQASTAFFAQTLFLFSILLCTFERPFSQAHCFYFSLSIIFLGLFFGTFFARLNVDYLLATLFFSFVWQFWDRKSAPFRLEHALGLVLLSIIKSIGLFFSLIAILSLLQRQRGNPLFWLTLFMILLNQILWQSHIHTYHLPPFAPLATIAHPMDGSFLQAWKLFIRDCLLTPADRIGTPYWIWYLGVVYLVFFKLKTAAYQILFKRFCLIALFFLISLGSLQYSVFNLGTKTTHSIEFARYFNTIWVPIVLFFILKTFKQYEITQRTIGIIVGLAGLLLITFYQQAQKPLKPAAAFAATLSQSIYPILKTLPPSQIFLLTKKDGENIHFQINYYLLAFQHRYHMNYPFDTNTPPLIHKSDYVIIYDHPDCHLPNGLYQVLSSQTNNLRLVASL